MFYIEYKIFHQMFCANHNFIFAFLKKLIIVMNILLIVKLINLNKHYKKLFFNSYIFYQKKYANAIPYIY